MSETTIDKQKSNKTYDACEMFQDLLFLFGSHRLHTVCRKKSLILNLNQYAYCTWILLSQTIKFIIWNRDDFIPQPMIYLK